MGTMLCCLSFTPSSGKIFKAICQHKEANQQGLGLSLSSRAEHSAVPSAANRKERKKTHRKKGRKEKGKGAMSKTLLDSNHKTKRGTANVNRMVLETGMVQENRAQGSHT